MFERHVMAMQHRIASTLRIELINPLLEEAGFEKNIVNMKFRSVTTRDEEGFAKWFGNLLRGFQFVKKKPFSINEIRQALNMNEIEGGDDDEWGGSIRDDNENEDDENNDDEDEEQRDGLNIQPTTD